MLQVAAVGTVLAAVLLSLLAADVWRRRRNPAGLSLACLLLSGAWWGLAYALELSSSDLPVREAWGDAKYAGVGGVAPAWLVFALQYTGRGHLVTRRRVAALLVEPVACLVALAVPATHDLVRSYPPATGPDELPLVSTGPLFWVHFAYTNVLLVVGTALFLAAMARLARAYWRLAGVLLAAALLPWAANLLHNFNAGPFARLDLTPFAFTVTGGVLVWGLHRERLVDLRPVARSVIVETMADGVLVLDAYGRVVDANPAAASVLGQDRADLVGAPLADLLPRQPGSPDGGRHGAEAGSRLALPGEPAVEQRIELALPVGGRLRHFDARRQPLSDRRGRTAGELVVLRDVTESREADLRLRAVLAERSRVAAALQRSLAPPALPAVPGLGTAACYAPAGQGHEIGGDFYDLFRLDDGRWAVVLGDVSGKGAEAAAVTAQVRYTMRALASGGDPPAAVLRTLNEALLRESVDERYATLVYAVAERAGRSWRLQVALAGHHPPLLRSRTGEVRPVGRPGTALGLLDEPELTDSEVLLHPGELLCLFTDGLVEARRGSELFGEQRVRQVLADSCPERLDDVVNRLEEAARAFSGGPLADDLALLLLRADAAPTAASSPPG